MSRVNVLARLRDIIKRPRAHLLAGDVAAGPHTKQHLPTAAVDPALGQRVYEARTRQLALRSRGSELAAAFDDVSVVLDDSLSVLLAGAQVESSAALESSVRSFDEGRVLLAA